MKEKKTRFCDGPKAVAEAPDHAAFLALRARGAFLVFGGSAGVAGAASASAAGSNSASFSVTWTDTMATSPMSFGRRVFVRCQF